MKICVAQTRPVKGDIAANIDKHIQLINLAVSGGAGVIIFPELSLTGYEPTLAKQLAMDKDDARLNAFQQISNDKNVTIGVGIPIQGDDKPAIGLVIFQPGKVRELYAKKYIHVDEEPFFVSGQSTIQSLGDKGDIALAICYEISVDAHTQKAFAGSAGIYIASVAKSVTGIGKALERLSYIANTYHATVLMSNCIGTCDGEDCAGKTSVFNNKGELLSQLKGGKEGILIFDTGTQEIIERSL